MFINVPRAYNFDRLTQNDCDELIEKKLDKEANRYILQFPEEKISVENGRWGPFLRFGKKMLKLTGKKYTQDEAAMLTLEELKKMVEAQVPDAFVKKEKKAPAKKAAAKKAATKKSTKKK
jgi:DNA topoisomerase-1